ncbi:MAG: hypothetical protein V1863_02490 [Candidatus Omnitrophota bacterium]
MTKKILPVFFIFFCLQLLLCLPAFSAFNLTVLPPDGGFDLRFRKLTPDDFKEAKEVTIQVSSDIGKQYRVIQRLIQPLTTTDGVAMRSEQFRMYSSINSNTRGTLVTMQETQVSSMDTVLYTSMPTGEADTFKLVYTITPSENQIQGTYYGKIAFVLVPIDSTQSQVVVTMNIYAELSAGSKPRFEVLTSSGTNRLTLSSKGMRFKKEMFPQEFPQVSLRVSSPLGVVYRIYQNLENGDLMSVQGEDFDLSKIEYAVASAKRSASASGGTLKDAARRQLIYTSDRNGSPDEITVTYKPAEDFRLQKAGFYKGKLSFVIEKDSMTSMAPEVLASLEIEADIISLFEIYVFSDGQEGVTLNFGEVGYRTELKTKALDIYVESNTGRPFSVIQNVAGDLASTSAEKIGREDFTVRVRDIEEVSQPHFYLKDSQPVKEGATVIYSSGPKGQSAHFQAEYALNVNADTRDGQYSTQIGFSLAEQ